MVKKTEEPILSQESAALRIQRTYRSYQRKKIHQTTFASDNFTQRHQYQFFLFRPNQEVSEKSLELFRRLNEISDQIAKKCKIIGTEVYHWTTLKNLNSIVDSGYFYGHKTLMKLKIPFEKNLLDELDIQYGDKNSICFCPNLVDGLLFWHKIEHENGLTQTIPRQDLIRLTIDLDKIAHYGTHHQYFKLTDFVAQNFNFLYKISPDLEMQFIHSRQKPTIYASITFQSPRYGELTFEEIIPIRDILFYGKNDIFTINKYCMSIFQKFLDSDFIMHAEFLKHLKSLSDTALEKILICFAQGLTHFAEYNFHDRLKLTPGLIKKIHFPRLNKTINLQDTDEKTYFMTLKNLIQDGSKIPPDRITNEHILDVKQKDDYKVIVTYNVLNLESIIFLKKSNPVRYKRFF